MTQPHPWTIGDHEARWNGYLIAPDSTVLRNRLAITTIDALQDAENDLLEFRLTQLRVRSVLVARTYDLTHLQQIHRHIFQDVYDWAGELRTVGLAKGGGESFMPPMEIERPVAHVAGRIVETDLLRSLSPEKLPGEIGYLYDYLNFAHPFREGNGRTQREFFAQLLAESDHGLAWNRIEMAELHSACHLARNDGGVGPLTAIFDAILTDEPSY